MRMIKKLNIFLLSAVFAASIPCYASAAEDTAFEILQDKNDGVIAGEYYLPTNPDTITWIRERIPLNTSNPRE